MSSIDIYTYKPNEGIYLKNLDYIEEEKVPDSVIKLRLEQTGEYKEKGIDYKLHLDRDIKVKYDNTDVGMQLKSKIWKTKEKPDKYGYNL